MPIAPRLERFLSRKGIAFREMAIEPAQNFEAAVTTSGRPQADFLRASLLIDINGPLMVVHGFNTSIDLDLVHGVTGRRLQFLTAHQAARLFPDCDPGFIPPVGAPFDVPVLVDNDVYSYSRAVMACGADDLMIELDRTSLNRALAEAGSGHVVIRGQSNGEREALTLEEVADRLQKLYRLPPMPALALRILKLTTNPDASAKELADLIEFDPSMTAQIMRYAGSALFNYQGEINSVQEAVTRVLGFDRVAHIALGIASVRAFEIPRKGMLGMDEFWRHSLYCAFLCQRLAGRCNKDGGLAYLCGLLHNFGLLLIGHLFPEEFDELNVLRESNPEASMQSLEQQVFGSGDQEQLLAVGHGAIGGILHRLWELPDAVVKSAGMHQHSDYHGDHEHYVLMVQLANALLKERQIGDEFNPDDLDSLSEGLSLSPQDLDNLREEVEQVSADLDALARSLSS
ncbi:HDOD domain-containing protein [Marinobacter sp. CHS3-4]|uniref:HDOD domain-containing protein n=1 Tax=Marinobacter sp. CHS3-4 TaxID=3045174 RepID=UPI0024B526F6|nr:HDOD domain-containing protein [Marinobacter sp. CHS3-4]MDI9246107.1 HDOD domain-containing protein [Marinobacter sp. CHS3-4]